MTLPQCSALLRRIRDTEIIYCLHILSGTNGGQGRIYSFMWNHTIQLLEDKSQKVFCIKAQDHMITQVRRSNSPPSCLRPGQPWRQTRLFRALSSLALKASEDGDRTASLSNLLKCLTVFMVKEIFPITQSEPLVSIYAHFLLSSTTIKSLAPSS